MFHYIVLLDYTIKYTNNTYVLINNVVNYSIISNKEWN